MHYHIKYLADLLRSMIGYWHNTVVCPSFCLPVCDAVYCGSQGWCAGLKVVRRPIKRVPNRHVSICPFRHFCV